jgi:anaerobic selenocysteine-containing dehydrogenase
METTWQQTACILCYINCGIEVRRGGEDGRRFERIRGDKAHTPVRRHSGWTTTRTGGTG